MHAGWFLEPRSRETLPSIITIGKKTKMMSGMETSALHTPTMSCEKHQTTQCDSIVSTRVGNCAQNG